MKPKVIAGSVIIIIAVLAAGVWGYMKYQDEEAVSDGQENACQNCGEMAWSQVYGCMDPLICSACGAEGWVPGHTWSGTNDAGETICVKCGQTEEAFEALAAVTSTATPAPNEESKPTEAPETAAPTEAPSAATPTAEPVEGNNDTTPEEGDRILAVNGDLSNLEANEQVIIDTIIRDIGIYNQFIYDHCGYSEEEYGPGPHAKEKNPDINSFSLHNGVMEYMDYLIDYIAGDYNPDEPLFLWAQLSHYTPVEEQIEEIRGCVFTQTPYNQAHPEDFQNYTMILKKFLEDGHPDIETIDSISLEWVDYLYEFDTKLCDVIATFTSDGETYKCYLNASSYMGMDGHYTVLDLERIE